MKRLIVVIGLVLLFQQVYSQKESNYHQVDTTFKKKMSWGVPIAFGALGLGLVLENSKSSMYWYSNKYNLRNEVQKHFPNFSNHTDDYLRYGPIAIGVGMNLAGLKSEHKYVGQAARLVTSYILMDAVVNNTKRMTKHLRPSGTSYNSFPSQHTAQAFCAARFLDKEFGKNYPWVRWLGYSMAIGTGALRVMNDAHWVSDVLVGACVGVLSVDLTYWVFDKAKAKNKNLVITPIASHKNYGFNLVYRF